MSNTAIRRAENGYILSEATRETIFITLDALFEYLLSKYEGRTESFLGKSYGKVIIERGKDTDVKS